MGSVSRMKTKRRRNRSQSGLILLETMFAIAILGTAVFASLVAVSTAAMATEKASTDARAAWIATSQIELIRAAPFVATPGQYAATSGLPDGYAVQNVTSAFADGEDDIQTVTVTVLKNGSSVLEIEVVKVNR